MNQGYKNEEFVLSNEEKKKSITPPDKTGNDGGKSRPDPIGKSTQEKEKEEIEEIDE